ncbi:MAG TPA: bifunctional 2-polyprenyl-6-hydroxyphenol methylase/3-demethylubiquinol 3-O-methyltransferase UbiG [Stellaceae bacterium]|nr:bifunctional 2-polyprenyl-6-hydroxyphenol methylase/3-demethylubiquinol 3-O-methyltransferase UbiG [Stellaceae bacterium]
MTSRSVDAGEIAHFAGMAGGWWDESGPFRPLHRINPIRLTYLRERLIGNFGRDAGKLRPFDGLSLVDIGCGGGLIAEPMARLGFTVTGIDATEKSLDVARVHAAAEDVAVDYRLETAEALAESGARFDVVLALEVVEHVADVTSFVDAVGTLLRPGGTAVLSTLNRTFRSYAFGIVGAEYVLRWLPRGTHRWSKFLKPSELAAALRHAGLVVEDLTGMSYDPLGDRWHLGRDLAINYLMTARKPAA